MTLPPWSAENAPTLYRRWRQRRSGQPYEQLIGDHPTRGRTVVEVHAGDSATLALQCMTTHLGPGFKTVTL